MISGGEFHEHDLAARRGHLHDSEADVVEELDSGRLEIREVAGVVDMAPRVEVGKPDRDRGAVGGHVERPEQNTLSSTSAKTHHSNPSI